jgi:branched-chain amino acid transport system permease protein
VRWAVALLGAAVTALIAVFAAVALAAPAQAASSSTATTAAGAPTAVTADGQTCVRPKPRNDDTIHIQGCLTDARKTPATAVPDVKITVEDESGNQVGEATTDQTGIFDIALPGKAEDIIGHSFTVHIDSDTLPEGTKLRNPKQESLKLTFNLQSDRFVTFPIGTKPKGESDWTRGLQLAVGGLVFSLLLAMASLGLSMIFGTTGLTNFAHGELITFGALVAFGIDRMSGDITLAGKNITMITAIIVATVASVIFGWVQDRWLWKPLRRRGTGLIAAMIVSIGFSVFLRNVYQYIAGADNHNYSQWTNPQPWHVGPIDITPKSVGVIILSVIVLLAVTFAVQRTRIGKATRAVADNPALAASSGINVDRVISVVWSVGAGLAGLSGVLLGMTQGFDYQLGFKILLLVFAAVVLGGLGSVWGAIIGSLVIGIFIEVSTLWVPAELKFVSALGVLIIVLLFRPQGILGRAERVG